MSFGAGRRAACKPHEPVLLQCHPAPECAPAVLQLSQELWRLGRGSVLKAECIEVMGRLPSALQDAHGRAPCQKFMADLEACRLEACGL